MDSRLAAPISLTHLQRLEAESIYIMREVVAQTATAMPFQRDYLVRFTGTTAERLRAATAQHHRQAAAVPGQGQEADPQRGGQAGPRASAGGRPARRATTLRRRRRGRAGAGGRGALGPSPLSGGPFADMFKDGFFPLKMGEIENGKPRVQMVATSVERKTLDPSLFVVPPDYKQINMGDMGKMRQPPPGQNP